jgi:predicted patatin/cPLA2 family phospholipase
VCNGIIMKNYDYPLILEGGGLRCTFTAGILEYFLKNSIQFLNVYGVSAGAGVAASYISGQRGRNFRVNVQMPSDPRFAGFRNFFKEGSFFGMNFLYNEIPNKIDPFDYETYFSTPVSFTVVVTSLDTGKPVYLTNNKNDKNYAMKLLTASGSIPLLAPPIEIDGSWYYDGGVGDSIPLDQALETYDKAVVILTRKRGYRKKAQKMKPYIKYKFRHFPEFAQALISRNDKYNSLLDKIDLLEKQGRIFVIAPEKPELIVGRMERKFLRLEAFYNYGHELISERYSDLQNFLQS